MVISSGLIIHKFNGLEALALSLGSNLRTGLPEHEANEARR